MSGSRPRVAVLHNAPVLPAEHPEVDCEVEVVEVAEIVAGALRQRGLEAELLCARPPVADVLQDLATLAPDVVFNMIEGFAGKTSGATYLTALLDLTGYAYTGSPAEALALCQSKGRTKAVLRGFGLPTAPSAVLALDEPVPGWEGAWPVIVKPEGEDASVGIDQESVVTDATALRARVELVRSRFGGRVLLEPYLPGPEFNVGVLALAEPEPLSVVQIRFDPVLGPWPILTYDAKWALDWEDEEASPVRCPAPIEPALADRLGRLAVASYRATGCRDYARVDFRLDDRGEPMILEVNPNPDLIPSGNWARALRSSGRDYSATLAALARRAWERGLEHSMVASLKHA